MSTVLIPTRISLQNILLADDFSACAEMALQYALTFARHYGSTLHMVNVLPHTPFMESPEPDPEKIKRFAQQRLASTVASDRFRGIKHTEVVAEGEVAEVVRDLVREKGIDLLVLGTGGRSGFGKFLLGSVAEEIFRSAECPVMTLGPHVSRGAIDGKLQHILFATDFGPESMHGVPYALSLAEEHRARLTLLHVSPEAGVMLPEPQPGAMPAPTPYEAVKNGEHELRALIPDHVQLWHEPEVLVQFGPAAETILRIARQDTDLIVLGVKRPTALTKHLGGGIAYKVVCDAPCPVLSVGARR